MRHEDGSAADRRAIAAVLARSRPGRIAALGVDVHFHPDATTGSGRTVLEALVEDRAWRTQFETGTSGGGLTARPGGDRWRWESRLFDGAYDAAPPADRPTYGGLRRDDGDPYGAAPRFGSAHLRLRASVLRRTTLCCPDSVFEPDAVGTAERAGSVLEALRIPMTDPLDRYVEAHVHGGVRFADVEALVLDPSFRGTAVGAAAERSGLAVRWHPGWRLSAFDELDAYRGPGVAAAARALADGADLTPARLGAARMDAAVRKRVWHLLAAFGRAPDSGRG